MKVQAHYILYHYIMKFLLIWTNIFRDKNILYQRQRQTLKGPF